MSAFDLLTPDLQVALKRLNITEPTQIQQSALPPVLQGRDVLATAQTGTGKTFAFLLPLITHLRARPESAALILSPTRELAQQTQAALESLVPPEELLSVLIIGGENIHKQYALLRRKPRLIIGTPGRIIDHILHKSIPLKNIAFLVLDEADRMLDMGFIPDVRKICTALPTPRQTLLFSATLPKEIEQLAGGLLVSPVRVQIGSVTRPVDLVVQQIIRLGTRERLGQLLTELESRRGQILIFVKSKHLADKLAKQLKQYGVKANALHGDLRQNRRRQVMEFFRTGTVPVLVATDVAARGLDVDGMTCVINYDLPQCPEDYIHRIGRTGRAGSVGTALSFILEEDDSKWKDIVRTCHLGKIAELTKGDRPLPKPKFVPDRGAAKPKKVSIQKEKSLPVVSSDKSRLEGKKTASAPSAAKKKPVPATVPAPDKSFGFAVMRVGRKKRQSGVSASQEKAAKHRRPFSFHFKKRRKK
ncbi:MAG: DEAD/DEAH box helicase [Elusimicrobiaceae bacterium]|nr:DEAD/DEAH box helicase [Elusimicrobiaceae bacterium]